MSDVRVMILDMVNRIITNTVTPDLSRSFQAGDWDAALWREVERAGLPLAALPEAAGGFGLALDDALAMLQPLAAACAPLPVGETMLAVWLAGQVGLSLGEGVHTIAPPGAAHSITLAREGTGWAIYGTANRVPWARHAVWTLVSAVVDGRSYVARIGPGHWQLTPGQNLAGEPRDDIVLSGHLGADAVRPLDGVSLLQLRALGAVMRCVQMSGAMQRALDLTFTYMGERTQFGRKLQQFQAVQQNLALLAEQVASAQAAAELAMEAARSALRVAPIAAAKIRCGEAARQVGQIAHQLHGAIGFTAEYTLQLATRRLWSWREEFGDERYWSEVIGREVCAQGGDGAWPWLTASTTYHTPPSAGSRNYPAAGVP